MVNSMIFILIFLKKISSKASSYRLSVSVLNELGWVEMMPYVANSILNRPTRPCVPLLGVTANLIQCKDTLLLVLY